MVVLVVLLVVVARSRPPARATAPRTLSVLAGIALVAFGIALGSIVIVANDLVFAVALGVAGITAAVFMWLVRALPDDDDEDGDDEPPDEPEAPHDGRRFGRKRTGGRRPRVPSP